MTDEEARREAWARYVSKVGRMHDAQSAFAYGWESRAPVVRLNEMERAIHRMHDLLCPDRCEPTVYWASYNAAIRGVLDTLEIPVEAPRER